MTNGHATTPSPDRTTLRLVTLLGGGIVAWWLVYGQLQPFAAWATARLPITPGTPLAEAVAFFLYDTPKVLMLLTLVVFAMGVVRSFFSPERTRALLSGRAEGVGNVAAAGLGIVTPFCSCSAVPLFIGFVSAGVPLGVTLSFLIAAPMINEVAVVLLFGLVGWKVAAIYVGFGLTLAIVAGWVIGRLHLEGWLEDWVLKIRSAPADLEAAKLSFADRVEAGREAVVDIVGRVWPWVIAGIAVGAFVHGWVPVDLVASIMGREAWWSVPAAVVIGVPIYSNAAGIIPIVEALLAKGAALGTVLAFMMSVIALSMPEFVILRKVMTLRLIAVFVTVVTLGILAVGFLFNAIFV